MTTEITPVQMEKYRKAAREREAQIQVQKGERRKRALEIARQAAQILKDEFSASRVVLFGSLLHPELYHLRSDIDLAVWGIQHYFRAVSRLIDIDPEFDFDLVPIEDASPPVLKVIQEEGKEL